MKIVSIVGARPQFIKAAPILRAIQAHNQHHPEHGIQEVLLHTGQHYDYNMSKVFFEELNLKEPNYNLAVGSGTHAYQTGEILKRIAAVLLKEKPDIVMVYGDTNSTLAGALGAAKLHIPVAHVEAGLRSYNRQMPEEINRVLTDHVSDILFCPTETAVDNLENEGFTNIVNNGHLVSHLHLHSALATGNTSVRVNDEPRTTNHEPVVFNVGDVMYDSVLYNVKLAEKHSKILKRLHFLPNEPNEPKSYALATVHRAENTDDPKRLKAIFNALSEVATKTPVVAPLHPRTQKALSRYFSNSELSTLNSKAMIIEPISYLDMLTLERNAELVLTDSGGVQKEAYWFRVPCVTLRDETEWVETVEAGWNVLVGCDPGRIVKAVGSAKPGSDQGDLYGDGRAAGRIVKLMVQFPLGTKGMQ